jgi:hypothetical protein
MRRVGLEPAIPVFERAKTFPDLDCAATVIGLDTFYGRNRRTSPPCSASTSLHALVVVRADGT